MQDAAYIPLRARDGSIRAHAIVDPADFEWLNGLRWSLQAGGYVQRGVVVDGKRLVILMHRLLLGLNAGDAREGDHRNGNRKDNRRENLRIVSHAGNAQNRTVGHGSSRYIGVRFRHEYGTWSAGVKIDGRQRQLGDFVTELDAAAAAAQFRHANMPCAIEDPALLAHVIAPDARRTRVPRIDRAAEIQRRWLAGESMADIAGALGCTRNALGSTMTKLRASGYDLPYRRVGWT